MQSALRSLDRPATSRYLEEDEAEAGPSSSFVQSRNGALVPRFDLPAVPDVRLIGVQRIARATAWQSLGAQLRFRF